MDDESIQEDGIIDENIQEDEIIDEIIDEIKKKTTAAKGTHQIFDKIMKRILTLSAVAVTNLINGLFDENFPRGSKLEYSWTENVKDDLEKTLSDAIVKVNGVKKFHIEAEIDASNKTIVIRMFDYGYMDALKHKEVKEDRIVLKFPKSKIIYLQHNENTPAEVILELVFEDEGKYEYKVPTVKFLNYTIESLSMNNIHRNYNGCAIYKYLWIMQPFSFCRAYPMNILTPQRIYI